METKNLTEYENEFRELCKKHGYDFLKRSETQIELVMMYGDQVDSRFDIKIEERIVICNYTLWVEGEGTLDSDEFYDDDDEDFNFIEELDRVMEKAKREYKKKAIDRGDDI